MATSKTFLLLGLVFTLVILILSEVSARELAETTNQVEKSGGNDQGERDPDDTRYGVGGNNVGKECPCYDTHKRNCKVGGEHGSNNRGGNGGIHERHGEHDPHNHRGELGGHERYNGGGKGGCHDHLDYRYCGGGGKGKGGRYERAGGPGSEVETETKN